jgi:hypothetical protein
MALTAPALVDGVPITEIWTPQTLIVHTTAGERVALPVAPAAQTAPTGAQLHAIWREHVTYPLAFCLPPALVRQASEAVIVSANGAPDRRYALRQEPGDQFDLLLESCERDAPLARYGVLLETLASLDASLGEPQNIDAATTITLLAIELTGPGEDPALPAGQARMRVVVDIGGAMKPLDWPAFAPTLLLAGGETLLPRTIETQPDGAVLTYLAPAPATASEVVWMATPPGSGRALRWRTTLPPLPSREAVVAASLQIEHVSAVLDTAETVRISIQLANRGNVPLVLTPTDISLTRAETPIQLPAIPDLTAPLAPADRRDLAFVLPLNSLRQPITLTIGARQFRLAVEP